MAISTYAQLQTAVASWLNRSDLTTQIPDFITLAESALNRRLNLRVMTQEASLSTTVSSRTVALPTAFIEPIALWRLDADRVPLIFRLPETMEICTTAGRPEYWAVDETIVFERPADAIYSLVFRYVQGFALSDAAPTNWLLTNHPDVYLFATLVEAAPYLRDDNLLAVMSARLEKAISEVTDKESRSRSLASLSTDLPRPRQGWDWLTGR